MGILYVMCYQNRAHFTRLWLKTGLGQEEMAESLQNWLIYTRVLHVKPRKYACWETQRWGRGAFYVAFPASDTLLKGICWHRNGRRRKTSLEPLPSPQSNLGSNSGGHWAIWGHWSNNLSHHTFLRVPDFKAIPKQFRQSIWLLASRPKTTKETEAAVARGAVLFPQPWPAFHPPRSAVCRISRPSVSSLPPFPVHLCKPFRCF